MRHDLDSNNKKNKQEKQNPNKKGHERLHAF